MSTEETKKEQQTIQIGQNLDGQEKYVLQLLLKIDNINAQSVQLYNELLASRREIQQFKQEKNQILQDQKLVTQELSKFESELSLLKIEKESMLKELKGLREENSNLQNNLVGCAEKEDVLDFDEAPPEGLG